MSSKKNIWVAAGDGDLVRVKELVEQECKSFTSSCTTYLDPNARSPVAFSPNIPDPNSYTPMHAAASYGQLHILEYLLAQGGNINIADSDGDTPLYTVENVQTARFLVENGALAARQNQEGVSPIDHLTEEFPDVAQYLRSTLAEPFGHPQRSTNLQIPSQYSQNTASEELATSLIASVQDLIERAETEGTDPEGELRTVVGRTVLQGVLTGYEMTTLDGPNDFQPPTKRSRTDENDGSV